MEPHFNFYVERVDDLGIFEIFQHTIWDTNSFRTGSMWN